MIADRIEERLARTDDRLRRTREAAADGDPKLRRFVLSGLKAFRRQRLKTLQKLLRQRAT